MRRLWYCGFIQLWYLISCCNWLIFVNWCGGYYVNYSWKLNRTVLIIIVTRKERKYRLIKLFWLVIMVDIFVWISEVAFDKIFSSYIKSRREDADF